MFCFEDYNVEFSLEKIDFDLYEVVFGFVNTVFDGMKFE